MKILSLQEKGKLGEKIARDFLVKKGYKIVRHRFYARQGEIDLIGLKDDLIVFIEVKTRTSDAFGSPEQSINQAKIAKIDRVVSRFFSRYPAYRKYLPCFDVISVELAKNQAQVRHYKNIMI